MAIEKATHILKNIPSPALREVFLMWQTFRGAVAETNRIVHESLIVHL
jgi:hypothetical protein